MMPALLIGLWSVSFVGVVVCILMLHRNRLVLRFRSSMLESIKRAAYDDRDAGRDWQWRYDAFDQVSYRRMVYRPWRRLRPESWYADTSFLRVGPR